MSERAGLFDGDTDFDVSGFAPRKTMPLTDNASPEKIRKVSEASNFKSREAAPAKLTTPKREPRRHRTGRNVQLSLKVRAETRDSFYAVADEGGWVLGEALDRAVAALKKELGAKKTV
jgi:hypothetical protein